MITGASKGIGLACAHGFAAEGVRVVGVNPGGIQAERAIDHFKEMAERELGDASR